MDYFGNYDDISNNGKTISVRASEKGQEIIEVNKDFILPDSYADIKRVLCITANVFPDDGYCEKNRYIYKGKLLCNVMYVSDELNVETVTFIPEYDGNYTFGEDENDIMAVSDPHIESITARAVNPRKIGIKARVKPNVSAWNRHSCRVEITGSVTDEDRMTFEEKSQTVAAMNMMQLSSGGIDAGDDIIIEKNAIPIKEIVFCNVNIICDNTAISENGVSVSGRAMVTMGYTCDDEKQKIIFMSHKIPVSHTIEAQGLDTDAICHACAYVEKISCVPAEDAAGDYRIAELDFTYNMNVIIANMCESDIVKDMYSTVFNNENKYNEMKYSSLLGRFSQTISVCGENKFPESGEVISTFANPKIDRVTLLSENSENENSNSAHNNVVVTGSIAVCTVVVENDGSIVSSSFDIPFSTEINVQPSGPVEYYGNVNIENITATVANGNISVCVDGNLEIILWENKNDTVISSVTLSSETVPVMSTPFTVYYPKEGESIWDIAKKYRVTRSSLILANSIDGNSVEGKQALIIPKSKRAVYSKIL